MKRPAKNFQFLLNVYDAASIRVRRGRPAVRRREVRMAKCPTFRLKERRRVPSMKRPAKNFPLLLNVYDAASIRVRRGRPAVRRREVRMAKCPTFRSKESRRVPSMKRPAKNFQFLLNVYDAASIRVRRGRPAVRRREVRMAKCPTFRLNERRRVPSMKRPAKK